MDPSLRLDSSNIKVEGEAIKHLTDQFCLYFSGICIKILDSDSDQSSSNWTHSLLRSLESLSGEISDFYLGHHLKFFFFFKYDQWIGFNKIVDQKKLWGSRGFMLSPPPIQRHYYHFGFLEPRPYITKYWDSNYRF